MTTKRAPKQWSLVKTEPITSFEAWRHNLQYTCTLSFDKHFAIFLVDRSSSLKNNATNPTRGLTNDGQDVPNRRSDAQKVAHLELMPGQIANYCPTISRNTIIKQSTSISSIGRLYECTSVPKGLEPISLISVLHLVKDQEIYTCTNVCQVSSITSCYNRMVVSLIVVVTRTAMKSYPPL